jgi:riboflavin kinase/FMN adenylyltransferase
VKSSSILESEVKSICIGGFDGIHLAHKKLFEHLDKYGCIVAIETKYANLTPKKYKEEYIDSAIVYYDLEEIRSLEAFDFIKKLQKRFPKLEKIVVGYDFRFGHNRKYSASDITKLSKLDVVVVDEVRLDDIPVHSRVIRGLIKDRDISLANRLLGRNYKLYGKKISGQGIGKDEFVPTINIEVEEFLIPASGIYATHIFIDGVKYRSVTFIGNRVTTDNSFAIETHIIDSYNLDHEDIVAIEFVEFIRENRKFDSFSLLKKAIFDDIKLANSLLA